MILSVKTNKDKEDNNRETSSVATLEKPKVKKPPLYRVILLNDDYTPCLLYTSPSPRDRTRSRMPSSA